MKMTWHHCSEGRNTPELNKGKVCIFKRGSRVDLEICVYIEDLFQPGRKFWVIKGAVDQKEVYPFAWLEIDKEFSDQFLGNLTRLANIVIEY